MTVEQAVYNIRHAQYGEEVRESIAEGIETIDQDVTAQNLEAEAWAVGTRDGEPVPPTDPAYHNNAKYHAENTDVHKDGNYPEMTVGTAEQLESTVMTEDKAPYVFRTSGGSADIGNREYDTLVGGTVAWNQLSPDANVKTLENWTIKTSNIVAASVATVDDHVYLLSDVVTEFTAAEGITYRYYWNDTPHSLNTPTGTLIYKATTVANNVFFVNFASGQAGKTVTKMSFKPQAFDLTQMFGTTIADYIYSLETANAGAGVAYFRNLFPKPYYPYNAGTLIHVNASAHKTVGFNLWDEEWEVGGYSSTDGSKTAGTSTIRSKNKIRVFSGTQYYFQMPQGAWVYCYDADETLILNVENPGTGDKNYLTVSEPIQKTLPANCEYITFQCFTAYGTTYKNDICINLSWSGTRNGEYEPYDAHTYPLDSDLVLRGIPKKDASGNLYYDGDTYEADGTVTRKYGIVDLGTLTWGATTYAGVTMMSATLATKQHNSSKTNCICAKYEVSNDIWSSSTLRDKLLSTNYAGDSIYVYDSSYTNAATFKTAMSGVYLVYELATPTTEQADPFTSPQIVDDWGTEEYIVTEQSGVAMPVGHVTKYPQNLRDKLQHLPNLASADGYYGIQQTGTQMVLVEPDSALSDTSKNAVQNKVVETALALKADKTDVAAADAALEQQILASFPTDTITDQPIASFSDGADDIPVKRLIANIEPIQSGAGDPSPSNVRPISGWTGANVVRSSASIIPKSNVYANSSVSIVTGNKTMLRRDFKDSSTSSNIGVLSDIFDVYDHLPAGRYKFTGAITASKTIYSVTARISDQSGVEYVDIPMNGQSFDVGNDWLLIALRVYTANGSASWSVGDWYEISNFSLGVESTTYPISWQTEAGTVYGGTLTDNGDGTWTLTVTQILSQFSWGDGSNPQVGDAYERRTFENAFASVVQTNATNCPNNIGIPYATAGDYARYYIASNGNRVQLYLPVGTSGDLIVQIVGNLATPVVYPPITAESVNTLLGDNNIFADCGNVNTLTYRADVGLYIDKKIGDTIGGSY